MLPNGPSISTITSNTMVQPVIGDRKKSLKKGNALNVSQ